MTKNHFYLFLFVLVLTSFKTKAQSKLDSLLPVKGFAIGVPQPNKIDSFIHFINYELAPHRINTLLLRIDYNYQYKSHPELVNGPAALSTKQVKDIVKACKQKGIRIIPQINLLGHQSWAERIGKLLEVYPQFDETPWVKMPEKYVWPNGDNLYCKSYCPLHPEVHKIVFDLVDEICDVFETDAFHAGMDEVFYIGDDKCPRCGGRDKAELFAGEVRAIRDHLSLKNRELWIWGDRLIDGKSTGIGMWEASFNNTYRAVDMISKDVVICDWHYERADKTAVYFAMKGFRVITCPWRTPAITTQQITDMITFKQHSTKEMASRFYGIMQTVWSGPSEFLNEFYNKTPTTTKTAGASFKAMCEKLDILAQQ